MNLNEAEKICKESGLVLYQDEVCVIVSIDRKHNRVLIEKGEYEGPGEELVCRLVDPEQLEAISG